MVPSDFFKKSNKSISLVCPFYWLFYIWASCSHLVFFPLIKGSLTRDFRHPIFIMNQCPPGPQVFHWGHIEFFRKFAEIFANKYLSPVSLTPAIIWSAVSTTPAINPCHGEITKKPKIFAVSTTPLKNCSPVPTTPTVNYSTVSTTPAIKESCLY